MRMPAREAGSWVQWQQQDTPRVLHADVVHPWFLIGDLDEAVPEYRTNLAKLEQELFLVVVHGEHTIEQGGDDVLIRTRAFEVDALGKGEADQEVRQCLDVVKDKLGLTSRLLVTPVMAEVHRRAVGVADHPLP